LKYVIGKSFTSGKWRIRWRDNVLAASEVTSLAIASQGLQKGHNGISPFSFKMKFEQA